MTLLPVTLKWNKQVYELSIEIGEAATRFKERVETLTGVPIARQKIIAKKGGWKGSLRDDVILNQSVIKETKTLTATLIGSAETLEGPTHKTTFIEDLSPQELRAAEDDELQAAMATAEGMIQTLQFPPHRRDDHKQEFYEYNRLVSGLPQRQIEQELRYGQGANNQELQGKVAMRLGLELRRGYVNDLTVLDDGTCVSVMDDGHVQLWKHGAQIQDVIHGPGGEGGVDSVVGLRQGNASQVSFATTGRGSLQLWSVDGNPLITVSGVIPGTTPASLVSVYGGNSVEFRHDNDDGFICLATCFEITRSTNPHQFRLPPQNEEERRRRAQAEAQEQAIQQALGKAARSIQVWFSVHDSNSPPSTSSATYSSLRYKMLEPSTGMEGSAPITSLACLSFPNSTRLLIAGDSAGGLRIWEVRRANNNDLETRQSGFYQFSPAGTRCAIVCMEALSGGRLAVSTDVGSHSSSQGLFGATVLPIPTARAVHILDFSQTADSTAPAIQSTLTGHVNDAVICMCQLPNGDLLTGGGKLDATLQLWSRNQIDGISGIIQKSEPHKALKEVGYVFALTVLPDAKNNSSYYAVAAGRYNTVKIII